MNKKVITLPISGSMRISHCKKLECALRDFIKSTGGSYYDDEISNGLISLYFKLDNEICIEQKVHIRQEKYVCYTTLSCYINPSQKEQLIKYIKIANGINRELDYGNFEINEKTGDIIFKSVYEPDERVCMESLDKLIGYPRYIINKYGYRLFVACKGGKDNDIQFINT